MYQNNNEPNAPLPPIHRETIIQEQIITPREQAELREKNVMIDQRQASIEVYQKAMDIQTTFMNPNIWTQIRAMGKVFFESKALPKHITNEAQLVMVLQFGFEMGMSPMESIKSTYMVNGLPNIYGAATTKRFKEHGWKIQYLNETNEQCTAKVTKLHRSGEVEEYTETMTYQMAVDSGYTKARDGEFKVGWQPGINRKLKLRYGALSIIIKSYVPEILGSAVDIAEVAEDYPQIEADKTSQLPAKISVIQDDKSATIKDIKQESLKEKLQAMKENSQVINQPVENGEKGGK